MRRPDVASGTRFVYKLPRRQHAATPFLDFSHAILQQLMSGDGQPLTSGSREACRHAAIWKIRAAIAVCLLVASWFLTDAARRCLAANTDEVERVALSPARPQQPVSLRDRLVVGLQARLKTEVAFVEEVAFRVRIGQLPQRLVDQTFFWARDRASVVRAGRTRRPIIYFQPVMAAQAKRLGVTL